MIGPGVGPTGEVKEDQQTYGTQLVSTITLLLGEKFVSSHRSGKPMLLPASAIDKSTVGNNR
ncbi:MAG: hypothetical protein ABI688_05590 [Bacteroidota bacterium]